MNTDKFLADEHWKHEKSRRQTESFWDVQYFSRFCGGWVQFKEYKNEEEAFLKAEILAEGFIDVRIIELTPNGDSIEAWRAKK